MRGIFATLFGIAAIFLPGMTLEVMVILLAIFLVADGVVAFAASLQGRRRGSRWGLLLFEGLAGIVIGFLTFVWPGITVLAIVLIIAFWAMLTGLLEIVAALTLRREMQGEWLLGVTGVLSVLFSLVLLMNPRVGAMAIIWMVGVYALLFGVLLIFLGLHLRKYKIIVDL